MRPFQMQRKMLTLGGAFYPKGYVVAMFANEDQARQAARMLAEHGFDESALMHLPPATLISEIGRAHGTSDIPLPSVGTEGENVRKYVALAREGQHALMIHAPSDEDTDKVMAALKGIPFSYAQKYHLLAIEDLEQE